MMSPLISVRSIDVQYPIFGQSERMLRHLLLKTIVGGKISNEKKVYVTALEDITFDIYPGDSIGLVGVNGSGKSTLLRLLAGGIKPTKGSILYNAHRVTSLLDVRGGFFEEATGIENTEIKAVIKEIPLNKRKKFINDVTELSGLKSYMSMPLRTYSSGMRLRLAFAIAILVETDIIIMDEVIGVADKEFHHHMISYIKKLVDDGKALVMASHSEVIVSDLCKKIICLKNGKLIDIYNS